MGLIIPMNFSHSFSTTTSEFSVVKIKYLLINWKIWWKSRLCL